MRRGADLTDLEQVEIVTLHHENKSISAIANRIKRHLSAVSTIIKRGTLRRVPKRKGPTRKITPHLRQVLLHQAKTG